jgi:hypothetical protein
MWDQRVDWHDLERAGETSRAFLRELAEHESDFREVILAVEDEPGLLAASERNAQFDFLALSDGSTGDRLGLHVSNGVMTHTAHTHPFSYSSLILCGGYQHTWLRPPAIEGAAPVPCVTRFEQPGSAYTLHFTAVHQTDVTPDTVTLVIRSDHERTPDAAALSRDHYRRLCGMLEALDVI